MGYVELTYGYCQETIYKEKRRFNESYKIGRTTFFCNIQCSNAYNNSNPDHI